MLRTSPSTTAPIDSSSRFNARPTLPSSNSRSSLTAASGRPEMRAMPSPTSRTRPTCAADMSGANPSRFLRRAALMSSRLIVRSATAVLSPLQGVAKQFETATDRAVDDGVAHAGDEAALDRLVDDDPDVDVLAGGLVQRVGQPGDLIVGEGDRRADLGDLLVGLTSAELDHRGDDRRDLTGPAVADEHADQVGGRGRRPAPEQVLHDLLAQGHRDVRVGQLLAELVVALEGTRNREQLVDDGPGVALGPGDRVQGLGVGLDPVALRRGLGHQLLPAPTWSMKLSTRALLVSGSRLRSTTRSAAPMAIVATSPRRSASACALAASMSDAAFWRCAA